MDVVIDTRGLACPLPVLKVRKAMRPLAPGTRAEILATDPGAEADFKAYCDASGYAFLSAAVLPDGVFRFVIQKF
ncbi:MAG TPA: sulfurtransferase TusA family protein [Hyphomicrobiales bacterium]|nr:sulfurtransferase TusA family protein [Hyphomicrobiales bacterium]